MRLVAWLTLLASLIIGTVGLVRVYTFEKDPLGYAEGVCPAPPNGVDSNERQDCLSSYQSKSGTDVAGTQLVVSAVLLLVASALFFVTRTDRGSISTRETAPGEPGAVP